MLGNLMDISLGIDMILLTLDQRHRNFIFWLLPKYLILIIQRVFL